MKNINNTRKHKLKIKLCKVAVIPASSSVNLALLSDLPLQVEDAHLLAYKEEDHSELTFIFKYM